MSELMSRKDRKLEACIELLTTERMSFTDFFYPGEIKYFEKYFREKDLPLVISPVKQQNSFNKKTQCIVFKKLMHNNKKKKKKR